MRLRPHSQVAQAAPDPAAPAADPAAPAADPAAPAPEAAPAPAPEAAAPAQPAEQPTVGGTPNLTDEELAKLAEQEAKTEVITVTGSLIGRKEVDSPSPVSVVDKQKLEGAGITNIGDILQKIPSQGNAINSQNNNGGDGSVRINLRSLGAARTLVLLNGRRIVPSGLGADDSVDFGTIPLAVIERVEVLKDGASAIYGSDAVAGVVNIITRSNFNGTEVSAYTATSQKGDGTVYDLSFVTGHSSAKGNVTFAASYQKQESVYAGDRGFAAQTYDYNWDCKDGLDADGEACDQRILSGSSSTPGGRLDRGLAPEDGEPDTRLSVPGCTSRYCTVEPNGTFRNYVSPTATEFNDAYNFQTLNYLYTPSQRVNLFATGNYEITKGVRLFFEGSFNSRKSEQQLAEEPANLSLFGTPISADSYYNTLKQEVVGYNRRLVEFGTRNFNQSVNTSRVVVGLDGTIPEDLPAFKNWKWELSYNYGRTDATDARRGDLILSHLAAALGPSYADPTSATGVSCGTPTDPIPGCVPLDLFHPGTVDAAAIKYLTFTSTNQGFNEQHTSQATASGKLVDLPNHGDISLALGADYRFQKGSFLPDPLTSTGDTTGNAQEPTVGSYNTFEGFGELSIVPVSGLEYLKWVEIDAAGRAYKYNTFGSGITGKISGLVRTVGGIALRGTYGSAFRAPSVSELYSGQSDSFPRVADPCDTTGGIVLDAKTQAQCTAQGVPTGSQFGTTQQRAKVGGNRDLEAEKAQVFTTGIVVEPLKGLDFTLDYWHINIDDAITSVPFGTILSQCYQGGDPTFCSLITRKASTHEIDYIYALQQNVGAVTTSGLDFSAAYQYKNEAGTFRHSVEGTYLFKYNVDTGDGTIIHGKGYYDLGVNPDLKFNIFTQWFHPSGLGAGFNVRFVNSFQECGGVTDNDCNTAANARRTIDSYATGDLFVNYQLKSSQGTTSIAAGVNNVINADPPLIYNSTALNADESYDFMGRQFYVRLSQLF